MLGTQTLIRPVARLPLREFYELTKPKVVLMITFTAVVGMLLAAPGMVPWQALLFGTIGIAGAAASGAAINHLIERDSDRRMQRTRNRPLPTGRLSLSQALTFALLLGAGSTALLAWQVNLLTAVLTFASLIGYAVVYTVFLKRSTSQNIVWGGAAGAMPPLLGWTAVTNEVGLLALLMFLIVFTWTPAHFWPLAINRREDYRNAGIPMLPVTHGVAFTKLHILVYSIMLLAVTLLPFGAGLTGPLYAVGALLLGIGFVREAWLLYREEGETRAMRTFSYSIGYLCALFAVMLADHYIYPATLMLRLG